MTAHAETASHDDHDHGFAHPMSIGMLLSVFFALIVLTVITVALANLRMGQWEIWTSLFIATIKAGLVMYFFMHLGWDKPFNAIVFLSTAFFLALFLGATLSDAANYRDALEPQADERGIVDTAEAGPAEGAAGPDAGAAVPVVPEDH